MRARWMFLVMLAVPGMLSAARGARLAEPKGTIAEASPTFTWSAVDTATQYDLWVVGRNGPAISESLAPADACANDSCSFVAREPLAAGPYLWLVLSRIPGNVDRWSSPRKFTVSPDGARPGKVELVAPSGDVDTTTPTFSWKPAGVGADYELVVRGSRPRTYFREVYAGASLCDDVICNAPPSITNLTLGDGKYNFTVRASNVVGRGPRSDAMRFNVQTLPQPPARPTLVSPRGRTSQTSPLFVWNEAERASEYYLEIQNAMGGRQGESYKADAILCPDTGTTCSIAPTSIDLAYGRYRFRVTGKNIAGPGRPSRWMNFRVGDYLDKPVAFAPEGMSGTSPTFQWYPVADATHYVLRVRQNRTRIATRRIEAAASCDAAMCSADLGLVLAEGNYRFSVSARSDVRRSSSSSDWMYFEAKAGGGSPPETPSSIAPTDVVQIKTPEFKWTHVPTATHYKLTVKDAFDPVLYSYTYSVDDAKCTESEGCKYTPSEMLTNGDYSFTVEAINAAGSSSPSAAMKFKVDVGGGGTPPGVPTIFGPMDTVKTSTPTFSWSPMTSATSYVLTVKNAVDPVVYTYEYGLDICDPANGFCAATPTDILGDGAYTFFITAKNGDVAGQPAEGKFTVDTAAAPAPSTPLAPSGDTGERNPTFSWSFVADAVAYTLVVTDELAPAEVHRMRYVLADLVCDATQCSVSVNPPLDLPDGTYNFTVISENDGGMTTTGSALRFNVVTSPAPSTPLAPAGDTAERNPTFSWSFVADAVAYTLVVTDELAPAEVHRMRYVLADLVCDATQCSVSVNPPLDLPDGTYNFTVISENDGGMTTTGSALRFNVVTSPAPSTPLAPAGDTAERNPTFSWSFVSDAVAYTLVVTDELAPAEVHRMRYVLADLVCDATQCSVSVNPPLDLPDSTYNFTVISENDGGNTTSGSELRFNVVTSPAPSTPLAPAGDTAERNPTFSWSFVSDAVAYTLVVTDELAPAEVHRMRYVLADLVCDATQCSVSVNPPLDLPDSTYNFTVISENDGGNTTSGSELRFNVSSTPPTVRVTSHNDGDTLAAGGILISGAVDSGTTSLTVQLEVDGSTVMAARAVEISPNDAFSVFLLPGQLSPGAATLTLVATDGVGGSSTLTFNFTVVAFDIKASMLLTRATFGATPALLEEIRTGGVTAFQDRLLNPVPDPGFDAFVATLPTSSESEAREYALMHAIFNPNSLQEVMAQFWDNHFSTDMDSHDVAEFELRENNTFRSQAFGRFRDLLEVSAKSPAMLIYLDATNNVVGDPNENYSREILELSTLGVNGGYTQDDIENLARIFTGWKEVGGNFAFVGSDHDFGTKEFLNVSFPTGAGAGLAEGEVVLDMLSEHRSTAEFLCTKSIRVFVTEAPRAGLVAGCADVFEAQHDNSNPNQMRDVVQFILDSPDFVDPANFRAKVKTPLELLASTVRHLDATVEDRRDLERDLDSDLDMELFGHRSPDGFSETADDWIDTSLLLARVNFVNEVARETGASDTYVDIRAYFQDKGFETAEGVVGYLFEIALQNEFTDLELAIAYDILSGRGTSQFDINGADAESRLRQLVGTVLSFPGFQHQ